MEAKDPSGGASAATPPSLAALPLLTAGNHAAADCKTSIDLRRGTVAPDPPVVATAPPLPGGGEGGGGSSSSKNPSSSSSPPGGAAMAPPPMMMMIQQQQSSSNNGNGNGSSGGGTASASAGAAMSSGSPFSHGSALTLGSGPLLKRKRGRPRKYVEGTTSSQSPVLIMGSSPPPPLPNPSPPPVSGISAISGLPTPPSPLGVALALAPLAAASNAAAASQLPFATAAATPPPASGEKKRGRPPGTGKKQQLAALGAWLAGSAGQGFTPHVITIAAGEDVATRIISFAQIGPRATCVLSANGAISNVTLRQPATSGGTVTYEGRFEILSLSGSFLLTENGNTKSRSGGLSVSLAGPDGRVIGGSVAGLLVAASPVQVVVGSFIAETRKPPQVQVRPTSGSSSEMLSGVANSPMASPMSTATRPPLGASPLNDAGHATATTAMATTTTTTTTNLNNTNANASASANANNSSSNANNSSSDGNASNNNNSSPVHHHHHHHHHMAWSSSPGDEQQNQGGGHGTDINISLPGS
ncbi:AT-hook motif nuclear-localized protein 10 [Selaginella moellendorffii]|uniref:AT-hook motif nuclear-localized protein 10 n=1 Tax=Selaginella moellendorffii TaxID=88036 RepID=UPI000D1C9700|nr:AT-hook motif nuclear-localized protein 10 [Selaginella moellendorffii]|eukprot:XP_024534766.1 AT-hook motif nuclear-localized protein 10 [Selaginella moellendorffii]